MSFREVSALLQKVTSHILLSYIRKKDKNMCLLCI